MCSLHFENNLLTFEGVASLNIKENTIIEAFVRFRFASVAITSTACPVPEFINPVFTKTSRKRSFSMTEDERFGLVFAKTGSINSGTVL